MELVHQLPPGLGARKPGGPQAVLYLLAANLGLLFFPSRGAAAAAAPPLYLIVLAATPVGGALYISASRYMDFMHAGWDILGRSAVGIAFAVLGFFWYHLAAPSIGAGKNRDDVTLLLSYRARRRSTAFFGGGFVVPAGGLEGGMQAQRRFGGEEYVDIELTAVDRQGHGIGMSGSGSGRLVQA